MYRLLPPQQPGLPAVSVNPDQALLTAYGTAHRRLFPAPQLPPEYLGEVDLGFLAVAGPYAGYLERTADGGYQWDLQHLAGYAHHPDLCSLGVRVVFRFDEAEGRLVADRIECELGSCRPDDPGWPMARQLALCAVTTHVSLIRHFKWVHLAVGGPFAIATRDCLPARHPLRRLLWPHMFGTQYSNQLITKGQLARGGDFESIFSFTHIGMCELFEDSYQAYDVTVLDPERDAERRGLTGVGFDTPSLDNQRAIFDVLHAHATAT
jgi:arachidonate 15-lipoxygenase